MITYCIHTPRSTGYELKPTVQIERNLIAGDSVKDKHKHINIYKNNKKCCLKADI